MSKDSIGDHLWAEMTDAQKVDAVIKGHATLKQMSEGLLDGSEQLRNACQDFLAHTGSAFEDLPVEAERLINLGQSLVPELIGQRFSSRQHLRSRNRPQGAEAKHRFGLPEGFVPRMQRFGRGVLLERNVYRLPTGQEFIPVQPSGTLGARRHLYALLTTEQYSKGKRGSIYVRNDGRVFDYSNDTANSSGDIFDTGYTIYDLERTGRYAPDLVRKRKKGQSPKTRRAAAGN